MALVFPPSPTNGQTYTDDNSVVWQFDSVKWNVVTGATKKMFNGAKVIFNTDYNLTSTSTAVNWDAESYDTTGYWNVSTANKIVIPQTGYYSINLVLFASTTGSGYNITLKKNGSVTLTTGTMNTNQAAEYYETMSLNSGDYLEVFASETNAVGALTTSSYLEVQQVGLGVGTGVNSYAAFSGVRTIRSTAFNTTSTPTALAWSSTEFDTNANAQALLYWDNSFPTKINIRVNGYYSVQMYVQLGSAGSNYTITLKKNGTTNLISSTGLSPNDDAWIEETYYLAANDYIELFVSDANATGSIANTTHMEVIRQGY